MLKDNLGNFTEAKTPTNKSDNTLLKVLSTMKVKKKKQTDFSSFQSDTDVHTENSKITEYLFPEIYLQMMISIIILSGEDWHFSGSMLKNRKKHTLKIFLEFGHLLTICINYLRPSVFT